jgi:hypothetical protein
VELDFRNDDFGAAAFRFCAKTCLSYLNIARTGCIRAALSQFRSCISLQPFVEAVTNFEIMRRTQNEVTQILCVLKATVARSVFNAAPSV